MAWRFRIGFDSHPMWVTYGHSSTCRKVIVARRENRSAARGIAPESILLDYGAALVIAWVVKNSLSTAPILMYQHSRSGVSMPGI